MNPSEDPPVARTLRSARWSNVDGISSLEGNVPGRRMNSKSTNRAMRRPNSAPLVGTIALTTSVSGPTGTTTTPTIIDKTTDDAKAERATHEEGYCHYPSPATAQEGCNPVNVRSSRSSMLETIGRGTCEICERLRGGRSSSIADAPPLIDQQRDLSESITLAEHATTGDFLNGSERESVLQREASPRYASSVVRWTSPLDMLQERCGLITRWTRKEGRVLAWTFLFLLVLACPVFADVHKSAAEIADRKAGVCKSIDIRNEVRHFSRLQGCRIVEGYLQILLIDNAEPSQYANISFPELREITGYLLLYRVSGLRSIGRLFPNLMVIRGNFLFLNYAFVAFEMTSLQEIGLHSLTTIARGSVRFEKNPALCYVDTIDWDRIAKAGKGEHVISGNNPGNGCPICEKHCPARLTKPNKTLCWNQQHCQRICDPECQNDACDASGKCCDSSCLGTCFGPSNRECAVCKGVITLDNECKDRCPNGTYEFMNRRCISEKQCRAMPKSRMAYNTKDFPYKPFNGSCVLECPPRYMEETVDGKLMCKKCEGRCLKECGSASVDSIASAQKLRGCTRIAGSLEIQIRGGKNTVKELEENLNGIEEIDGYLKIVRSFSLISLNFLKSLRVIRGKNIGNSKHTLTVLDNQNLQELWDWQWHPEIRIEKDGKPGTVFFHLNPKLCLYKIEALRDRAGLNPFTDLEVSPNSNGDKVACNVTELKTRVGNKSPWGAVIEWEPFVHHDERSLLGYVVYFIEAPYKNVTMYDGRDACGGDGWKVDDVTASANVSAYNSSQTMKNPESHYLSQLKPYTQYAYYVKTYTIATERSGAQSKLTYFRTLPDAPTAPRSLVTWSNSSSVLVVAWYPPLNKNGNLTHYRIFGRWEPEDANFINLRNYCNEPMRPADKKTISAAQEEERKRAEEEMEETTVAETGTCDCGSRESGRETDRSMREKEVSSSIEFEDALHNQVYIKRKNARRKRDLSEMPLTSFMSAAANAARKRDTSSASDNDQLSADKIVNGTYISFERVVPSTNLTFVMRNLRHFSTYNIEVQACRAAEANDTLPKCSSKSVKTYRTLPKDDADDIPPESFDVAVSGENNSSSVVTLRWDEPPQPNGLIVTYQVEYKKVGAQGIGPMIRCITRSEFAKSGNSYRLIDMSSGNYTVRVRATSLVGYGAYTPVKYFLIKDQNTHYAFWLVFGPVVCVILLLILSGTFIYVWKQKSWRTGQNRTLIAEVNPEYVSTREYTPDEWEVPREKIEVVKPLGQGSFGMVYMGIARDIVKGKPEVRCAVKTVNENATDRDRIEFLNEASVMKGFNAHHIVKLLGVVTQGQPTLVIMELMALGDLKNYLRSHRPKTPEHQSPKSDPDKPKIDPSCTPPKLERILQMAIEIADGMAYLETKKFVHRDLAARNCMVAEDLTVKIGDFGMTRDVYEKNYYRKISKGLLPIRWMAPESLKDGEFSSYSDVWSYGVVLWEMVTLASQPYQGLSNDQVLQYVIGGGVMNRPENCPELLFKLMRCTWRHKASMRPTFMEITRMLLDHINEEPFEKVSFYHSAEGIEARKHLDMQKLNMQDEDFEGEATEDSPLRQDTSTENSLSPRSRLDFYGENSKTLSNCYDMNSSNVAPKSGFFLGSLLASPSPTKRRSKPDYENRSLDVLDVLSCTEKKETDPLREDFSSMDAVDSSLDRKSTTVSTVEYVNKRKPETLNNGYIGGTAT